MVNRTSEALKSMMKRAELWMVVCILAVAIPVRAQEGTNKKQPPEVPAGSVVSDSAKKAATDNPNYLIGAQDVLDISVWKEPELTHSVPVRPDGKISMPLLNDVQAAGLTPI